MAGESQRGWAPCNSRRQALLKSRSGSISLISSGRSKNVPFGERYVSIINRPAYSAAPMTASVEKIFFQAMRAYKPTNFETSDLSSTSASAWILDASSMKLLWSLFTLGRSPQRMADEVFASLRHPIRENRRWRPRKPLVELASGFQRSNGRRGRRGFARTPYCRKAEHGHVNFCLLTNPLVHGFSERARYKLYGLVY